MANIALIAPNKNEYSETFIQQHKVNLKGNVIFYFDGFLPSKNNIEGSIIEEIGLIERLAVKFTKSTFTIKELALIKSLKKNKIDVVIAEYGPTAARVLNVCLYLEIPIVPIFHGSDASEFELISKFKDYYVKLFNNAPKIITVSNKLKQNLLSLGCLEEKLIVTPCAPSDIFFEVNPTFSNQQFVGVGRFVDKKAPYYTILAFNFVLKTFPNSSLVLIGQGPLFNTCKNLIKYLNIENNVRLIGIATPDDIKYFFENSICFVQHSVTALNGDSEGTPVSILEASAAGLPVVSTKHSGITDVIIDGKTGYLVNEHNIQEMAEKMTLILSDLKNAKQMGCNGKNYIKSNYSKKKHIAILDNLIEQILI